MDHKKNKFKGLLQEVIFEADTKWGKRFDIILLWAIALSVLLVTLESVSSLKLKYGAWFYALEWGFTVLFTIEYLLRIYSVRKPFSYIFSFYGIIDLLSILPTFLGIFFGATHSIRVVRILRLLRVFRVLKLISFSKQAMQLKKALIASKQKIIVFMLAVTLLVVILGTLMYMIETPEAGFTSIPRSIYWAIVTLTTVGYGDITPQSVLGQTLASVIMIVGYAIIAVPTGIVTAEIMRTPIAINTNVCPSCAKEGHDDDAKFCKYCGEEL